MERVAEAADVLGAVVHSAQTLLGLGTAVVIHGDPDAVHRDFKWFIEVDHHITRAVDGIVDTDIRFVCSRGDGEGMTGIDCVSAHIA